MHYNDYLAIYSKKGNICGEKELLSKLCILKYRVLRITSQLDGIIAGSIDIEC